MVKLPGTHRGFDVKNSTIIVYGKQAKRAVKALKGILVNVAPAF